MAPGMGTTVRMFRPYPTHRIAEPVVAHVAHHAHDLDVACHGHLEGLPEGTVTLEGILRLPGWSGWESMRPDNDPGGNRWYYFDIPAMAEAAGLERPVTEFYVEAVGDEASGLLPIGLQLTVDLPNDHLEYAITWFALAIALVGVYLVSQTRREPQAPRARR